MSVPARRPRGFTVIELLTVLVVLGVLAALGLPSFMEQLARRKLEGVATELSTDLQYARTQSVSDRVNVRLRTTNGGAQYIVDKEDGSLTYKTINLPSGVVVTNGVTVTYNSLRGMITSNVDQQIDVSSGQTTATLRTVVNVMGRVALCSPGGALKGYPSC